mgnify:CR=1 FL=1
MYRDNYSKENITSVKYNLTSPFDMNSKQPNLKKKYRLFHDHIVVWP